MLGYRTNAKEFHNCVYKLGNIYIRSKKVVRKLFIRSYEIQQKFMHAQAKHESRGIRYAFLTCIQLGDQEKARE